MDLRQYMKAGAIKLHIASAELNVSMGALSRYASGQRVPRPAIARRIIEWSGGKITAEDLLRASKK